MSDRETSLFSELRSIDESNKLGYARAGLICSQVEKQMLYKERIHPDTGEPCTFNEWVKLAAPWSYATVHAAMRDVESLSDIPAEEIERIPARNFPIVKQLSTAVRAKPEVMRAAQTKSSRDLAAYVQREHPSQHIERPVVMRFMPEESAAAKIEEALSMAETKGAKTRNEQLEMVAVEAMLAWQLEAEIEKVPQ